MARTERELGARDKHTRDGDTYAPPGTLPEPAPEPGWVFRWIATHVMSRPDNSNVSKKMREGWEPVKAVDQPQMEVLGDASGNIEIGGLMLCKAPEEKMLNRNEYYKKQAENQIVSVDNSFMRESDPRMPLFKDRKSKVTFGTGDN